MQDMVDPIVHLLIVMELLQDQQPVQEMVPVLHRISVNAILDLEDFNANLPIVVES